MYADPNPQNLINADPNPDPGQLNHQIDLKPYLKSQEKRIFPNLYLNLKRLATFLGFFTKKTRKIFPYIMPV